MESDKIPVKVLLNKFISSGKLPVPVLSLSGADRMSEHALNNAIREFQKRYVPINNADGRIDKKNSKTLKLLNKQPSQVKLLPKAYKKITQLKDAVGKRVGSVNPKNRPADVKWVQDRLNVQIHFGKIPGYTKDDFVPTSGHINPHKLDDPTLSAIIAVQNFVLKDRRATGVGVIEPGDEMDIWLQQVFVRDPSELLDSFLTKKQQLAHRLYNAIHSSYFDRTTNRNDKLIMEIVNVLLRKDCDDSYISKTDIKTYISQGELTSRPLEISSLKSFLMHNNQLVHQGNRIKSGDIHWIDFLRKHLVDEIIEDPRVAHMQESVESSHDITRARTNKITDWWIEHSKKKNSIFSVQQVSAYHPYWHQ